MLGEELDIVAAVVEGVADAIFEEVLGEVHVLVDIDEGYFGLYHPELGQVAGGVGVFGTECGAEGVDGSEGCGSELAFELSADGEGCGFAEEVGGVVYFALLGERKAGEGKRGDLEHGSGAFAVAGGDEGGVEVVESSLLEVAVDGEGEGGAHAEHGREGVGAWAQVGYLAEELEGVSFFLEGIGVGVGGAVDLERGGLDLDRLSFALALDEDAAYGGSGSGGEGLELLVGEGVHVEHYLDVAYG